MLAATLVLLPFAGIGAATESGGVSCADDHDTLTRWRAVRADPDAGDPDTLAPALAECLASANPELRDHIAYEVLAYWLRQERLGAATVEGLRHRLQPWLTRSEPEWVYGRAFSALVLSELVRFDAGARQWSPQTLGALASDALAMLAAEQDFRGLDDAHGWIHAIAHGSDLLWRLARHPGLGAAPLQKILDGVAGKVAPPGNHPYVFGEFDRLARVVLAVAQRDALEPGALDRWLGQFSRPRHMSRWHDAFATPAGMAELHNTRGFLRALRELLREAQGEHHLAALDGILAVLPRG